MHGQRQSLIAVVDCGGANDQVLSLHTFRQVADDHGDAQRPQMLHRRALLHIRARNHQALALKNLRQGGHGHAANPHQMCPFAGHDIIMDSINRHWVYTPFPFRYNIGWTR